jgi:cytochrome P450
LTLATVAQRFRLEALEDPVPEPLITLRPRGGVRVRLHAR